MAECMLSMKYDVVFKTFFVRNVELLKDFIQSVLLLSDEELEGLTVCNEELPVDGPSTKFSRLDLNLRLKTKQLNIEVQRKNQLDFSERALYCWARLYSSDLKAGDDYSNLHSTISLCLVDFVMFPERVEYFIEIVASIRGTKTVFSDKINLYFGELGKFKKWLKKQRDKGNNGMNSEFKADRQMRWLEFYMESLNKTVIKKFKITKSA